jgi:hypothetical protein
MYVDSVIQNYQLPPKEIDGNMNGLTCWKLYESKELERFIKRLPHTPGEV